MACFHPLVAFDLGLTASGKKNLKVYPSGVVRLVMRNGKWQPDHTTEFLPYNTAVMYPFCELPCGKCIGCQMDYSRMWANRCVMESKMHAASLFVTLTYDDLSVPRVLYGERENGEAREAMSLRKKDLQKFMKRLRSYVAYHISDTFSACPISMRDSVPELRYFASGEYGSSTLRPHYHLILFGFDLPDKKLMSNRRGNPYYVSDILAELWPFGHHIIGDVSFSSAAYVARYCMKKAGKESKGSYEFYGIEKPFLVMSRKPGIGATYYDKYLKGKSPVDTIHLSTAEGGLSFQWPRYFENLYEKDDPDGLVSIKSDRLEAMKDMMEIKSTIAGVPYHDVLLSEEECKKHSLKKLRRNL